MIFLLKQHKLTGKKKNRRKKKVKGRQGSGKKEEEKRREDKIKIKERRPHYFSMSLIRHEGKIIQLKLWCCLL